MALTGARVGDICYPSTAEAADAYYSALPPQFFQSSTAGSVDQVLMMKNPTTNNWLVTIYNITGNTRTTESQIAAQTASWLFPSCDPTLSAPRSEMMFQDGMSMGWGVVGAVFAALAVIFITKALFK